MSVTVKVLQAGSDGNAIFFRAGETRILLDAGLPIRLLRSSLSMIDEDPGNLDAVCVSHSHGDHSMGLCGLLAHYQTQCYLTPGTRQELDQVFLKTLAIPRMLRTSEPVSIGSIDVLPVGVPHDCAEPCGFLLRAEQRWYGFVTDTAYLDNSLSDTLGYMDFLYLEANHDRDALLASVFPPKLKQRVLSNHLSNAQVSEFLSGSLRPTCADVVLGHLSATNNDPMLVYGVAREALAGRNTKVGVVPASSGSSLYQFS